MLSELTDIARMLAYHRHRVDELIELYNFQNERTPLQECDFESAREELTSAVNADFMGASRIENAIFIINFLENKK